MEKRLSKGRKIEFQTTESAQLFETKAELFMGQEVKVENMHF
jgi:hypothetical protein